MRKGAGAVAAAREESISQLDLRLVLNAQQLKCSSINRQKHERCSRLTPGPETARGGTTPKRHLPDFGPWNDCSNRKVRSRQTRQIASLLAVLANAEVGENPTKRRKMSGSS